MSGMLDAGGGGSYDPDEHEYQGGYVHPSEEEEDGTFDVVLDETTEHLQTSPGALGAASFLYQTGSVFEGNEEEVRETVMEDEDASWWVKATTTASTTVSDPSTDGASDTFEVFTSHAVDDSTDRVTDAATGAADDAVARLLPEHWKLWAGGIGLLVVLVLLAPYAKLGAEVAD